MLSAYGTCICIGMVAKGTFSSLMALILEPVSAIAATISSLLPMVMKHQLHTIMNYDMVSTVAIAEELY